MTLSTAKHSIPVERVRRYLEPGPIVLVSSRWRNETNIMTMGWHLIMEFSPSLIGCVIAAGNHSFEMIHQSRECVINLPTTHLTNTVVKIGNTSSADIDKFGTFGLTAMNAEGVDAPLITECHGNFACRLYDGALVQKYNFFNMRPLYSLPRSRMSLNAAQNVSPTHATPSWKSFRSAVWVGFSKLDCLSHGEPKLISGGTSSRARILYRCGLRPSQRFRDGPVVAARVHG